MENELVTEPQEKEIVLSPSEVEEPEDAVEIVTSEKEEQVEAAAEPEEEEAIEVAEDEQPEKPAQVDEEPEITPDIQAKLDKLEKRLGYEQRQREKLEKKLSRRIPAEEEKEAPKEADFESYEEFQDALVDYKVQKQIGEYEQKVTHEADADDLQEFIDDTLTLGRESYSDFSDVAEAQTVPITQQMLRIMRDNEMENPEGIAYYLGKNLKECQTISRMGAMQQVRALSKIEDKVASQVKSPPKQRTPKKVTAAPEPIKPTGSVGVVSKNPAEMSQREYEQWRMQGGGT